MNPERLTPEAFAKEFQTQVREFTETMHASLDNVNDERGNHGDLVRPTNDDSLDAATWKAQVPELPERFQHLLPFDTNEEVKIDARYRYGTYLALVNFWISSEFDEDRPDTFRSFSLGLSVDPATGGWNQDSNMNGCGSDSTERVDITETDVREIMATIFACNDAYQAGADSLDVVSALRLGIVTQSDLGAEQYTFEKAVKIFGIASRHDRHDMANGFQLSVSVADRTHPNDKPSTTYVTLQRYFEGPDYAPDGVYDGYLIQRLVIKQALDGTVTSMTRDSKIDFFDQPAAVIVNGKPTVMALASEAVYDIPPKLAEKLYPTETPTLDDLAFFKRLVTQPIQTDDAYAL